MAVIQGQRSQPLITPDSPFSTPVNKEKLREEMRMILAVGKSLLPFVVFIPFTWIPEWWEKAKEGKMSFRESLWFAIQWVVDVLTIFTLGTFSVEAYATKGLSGLPAIGKEILEQTTIFGFKNTIREFKNIGEMLRDWYNKKGYRELAAKLEEFLKKFPENLQETAREFLKYIREELLEKGLNYSKQFFFNTNKLLNDAEALEKLAQESPKAANMLKGLKQGEKIATALFLIDKSYMYRLNRISKNLGDIALEIYNLAAKAAADLIAEKHGLSYIYLPHGGDEFLIAFLGDAEKIKLATQEFEKILENFIDNLFEQRILSILPPNFLSPEEINNLRILFNKTKITKGTASIERTAEGLRVIGENGNEIKDIYHYMGQKEVEQLLSKLPIATKNYFQNLKNKLNQLKQSLNVTLKDLRQISIENANELLKRKEAFAISLKIEIEGADMFKHFENLTNAAEKGTVALQLRRTINPSIANLLGHDFLDGLVDLFRVSFEEAKKKRGIEGLEILRVEGQGPFNFLLKCGNGLCNPSEFKKIIEEAERIFQQRLNALFGRNEVIFTLLKGESFEELAKAKIPSGATLKLLEVNENILNGFIDYATLKDMKTIEQELRSLSKGANNKEIKVLLKTISDFKDKHGRNIDDFLDLLVHNYAKEMRIERITRDFVIQTLEKFIPLTIVIGTKTLLLKEQQKNQQPQKPPEKRQQPQ